MSNTIVSLGGVQFQDFEVPERIAFSGAQRMAVQRLIGGGRVVNVLGGDDGEIIFCGIFSGNDASARAQALDLIRGLGDAVPLIWGDFFYNVIIAEFMVDYTKRWWLPFRVRCVVTADALADVAAPSVSTAALIAGDVIAATSLSGQAGLGIAGLADPTASGLAAAQSALDSALTLGGNALNGSTAAIAEAADAPAGIAAINSAVADAATLAGLSQMSGFINRAAVNFAVQMP